MSKLRDSPPLHFTRYVRRIPPQFARCNIRTPSSLHIRILLLACAMDRIGYWQFWFGPLSVEL